MSDPSYSMIEKRIRKTYPQSCIVSIFRIHNDVLLQKYEKMKDYLIEKNGAVDVLQLFHGTSVSAADKIRVEGFKKEKNKTYVFGIGSYFAKDASYSFGYMKPGKEEKSYMFLCDCIIGKKGRTGSREIDTDKMDCSVDNIDNPTIFSIPYDDAIFPRYLIEFHKNAK